MKMFRSYYLIISALLITISGCDKSKLKCENIASTGRIIGYNPCLNYTTFNKVSGAGFVIEIDNGLSKDTAVTYDISEGLFVFLPSYIDNAYSSFLFRPEVQNLFRIKFNYKISNQKTIVLCFNQNTADFLRAVREKEIDIFCIDKL